MALPFFRNGITGTEGSQAFFLCVLFEVLSGGGHFRKVQGGNRGDWLHADRGVPWGESDTHLGGERGDPQAAEPANGPARASMPMSLK